MKQIRCPETYSDNTTSIFVAGGISGCEEWQTNFIKQFENEDVVLINPRRESFDEKNKNLEREQIEWEFEHLEKADIISFWFPKETLCPITLYELGRWLHSKRQVFIGIDLDYKRKTDVEIQTDLARNDVEIVYCLEDLANKIKEYLRK